MVQNGKRETLTRHPSHTPLTLARAMEKDISSKFTRGEKFLTVREAARRYGVSPMTAHRTMQQLAKRRVLEIRQGAGSFVGPAAGNRSRRVKIVHFITPKMELETAILGGALNGLIKALPHVSIQVNPEPEGQPDEYLEELWFGQGDEGKGTIGAVLSGVSYDVRLFFAKRNLPAVVCGHTEDDLDLPYVDYDQRQMGYKLASFLLDKGHQRLGLLLQERWLPGDTLFLRGLQRALAERSIAADQFRLQPVSLDGLLAKRTISRILTRPHRPTALICRREPIALACLETAKEMQLRVPDDLALVSASPGDLQVRDADPPITSVSRDFQKVAQIAGELLTRHIEGRLADGAQVELPTRLIVRQST